MNDREPVTHAMIMDTDAESNDQPILLMPDAAWIGIHIHLPEDLETLHNNPEFAASAPEFGPEDNMVSVVLNNVDRETARQLLTHLLQTLDDESTEVAE